MRQFLLKAFTILFWSPVLLLANQAALGSTDSSTSQKGQETTKSKAESRPTSPSVSPAQGYGDKSDGNVSQIVLSFFKREGERQFGITDPQKEIRILRVEKVPNFPDRRIARVQQLVGGVPVFGARATLVVTPGKAVERVTSDLIPSRGVANIKIAPTLNWLEAVERAMDHYRLLFAVPIRCNLAGAEGVSCPITAQLLVFDPARVGIKAGAARLAWMARLDTFVMFIDAHDGSLIFQYSDLQSAQARETYDLKNAEGTGGHGVLVLDENGPIPGEQVPRDADMAHGAAAKVYEFFNNLGRDSYNDGGGSLVSNVRVAIDSTNAMWHPHGMAYYRPQVPDAVDLVGHEFTHGVIQYSAGLKYFGESGALNEGFADYFGTQIEGASNWTIGENFSDGPLRDMENPHNGGFDPEEPPWPKDSAQPNTGQPAHYTEMVRKDHDEICDYSSYSERKNGCPHLNSGIFNKAAHLASAGGSHHGIQVKGITSEKLTRIFYAALLELNPLSNMSTTARVIAKSCMDLVGQYQISQADCTEVKKAFEAVGLPVP